MVQKKKPVSKKVVKKPVTKKKPVKTVAKKPAAKKKAVDKSVNKVNSKSIVKNCTEKEETFARLYATTGDATQSHIDAGYSVYKSRQMNSVNAYKVLQKPHVIERLEYYRIQLAKKIDISEKRILAEMGAMGLSNIVEVLDDEGNVKNLHSLDQRTQRAIKSIKVTETITDGGKDKSDVLTRNTTIEMHPKLPALKFLAELKGMEGTTKKQKPVSVTVNIAGKEVSANVE